MDLTTWIGTQERVTDILGATPCAALAATLDRPAERPERGAALPPLWHWLYFLPLYRQSEVGPDGHARRGGFLPPVPLPRRMWAGSQFRFHAPLRIGDEVERTSTIDAVSEKEGRSGRLVFVKVRHEVRRRHEAEVALTEFHDIVYREAPRLGAPEPAPLAAPADADWEREVVPDDVLLFRYSALTFNGHRIHYDRRYVTEVEGYPGLVVHGPLIATLLLDLLRERLPEAVVTAFSFRALRPVFDIHRFHVCGARQADGPVRLWARDHEGWLCMDASATLAPGEPA
ncbi:acyl-CoA dehydrogenase [Massilia sp. KIM]|uniref:FAS1-like dehydratase domain-containing protein n=1 Tax=Massilia sp. KIM TaxID=1955422 RepID=UPI00098F3526|nr:MaoC family dehydratase N-terminal domain-containing protein [Massilia sp. KIM]OON64075.1 acyl-CoA dehydrogenase [Massilia sp. KIM]